LDISQGRYRDVAINGDIFDEHGRPQMANRAYLLNTLILTGDPYALQASLNEGSNADYAEIAEVSYRVSLPWLCCFRGAHLTEVRVPLEYWGEKNGPDELVIELPCIDVGTALRNLQDSLETFQQMAGDPAVGRAYWLRACDGLDGLPLPYLAMNPIEVLLMGELDGVATKFSACFRSQAPALDLLKYWSGFHDGFQPFSAEDFYSKSPTELDHVARLNSSRALDAGYLGGDYFWHRGVRNDISATQVDAKAIAPALSEAAGAESRPWWRIW
jgi:hypothetical protein